MWAMPHVARSRSLGKLMGIRSAILRKKALQELSTLPDVSEFSKPGSFLATTRSCLSSHVSSQLTWNRGTCFDTMRFKSLMWFIKFGNFLLNICALSPALTVRSIRNYSPKILKRWPDLKHLVALVAPQISLASLAG